VDQDWGSVGNDWGVDGMNNWGVDGMNNWDGMSYWNNNAGSWGSVDVLGAVSDWDDGLGDDWGSNNGLLDDWGSNDGWGLTDNLKVTIMYNGLVSYNNRGTSDNSDSGLSNQDTGGSGGDEGKDNSDGLHIEVGFLVLETENED